MEGLTVGVDVGGTFTDIIRFDAHTGGLSVLKIPTSRDPSSAILRGLREMGATGRDVTLVSHATTIATNSLLTRSGLARTALITNEGFRDVLEIGRQRRPELYDLYTRRPQPLIPRSDRFTVRCRMKSDGSVLEPLDKAAARAAAKTIVDGRFESVAVCFLNSYANPAHEKSMGKILVEEGFRGHVSLSCEVDREYREYERTSTTVVNAFLAPPMAGYLSRLSKSLRKDGIGAPLYVMNSDGGMTTVRSASLRPVSAIESGPAAGVLAAQHLAKQLALRRVLTFDMGGTTAKAGTVIDFQPDFTSEFEAAGRTHSGRSIRGSGYAVRGFFIDLAEVSAGGGTIARVDEGGALNVGPRSAGSEPGPACYGRGGREPTVTDANVVLGRINPRYLLGGKMRIQAGLASRSIATLARRMGTTLQQAAAGVLKIVNNNMAKAISIVSVERGRDPRDFTLLSFGGAGPVHACDLAEEMGIREIFIPPHAGLFSAYGLLVAEPALTFMTPVGGRVSSLPPHFKALERMASAEMKLDGFTEFSQLKHVEARYEGQSHELLIPYSGIQWLRESFDRRHKELYSYSTGDPVEVVNAKLTAVVHRQGPGRLTSEVQTGNEAQVNRLAWFGGRMHDTPIRARKNMHPGDRGTGPCIIEEYDSTIVVNPAWRWRIEEQGTRLSG